MQKKIAAYFLSTILLFLIAIDCNAATACFTPSAIKGCAPFTITLDPSCAVYDPTIATPQYNYDFINKPGGANFTTSTTHIFTIPGTYRVLQFIGNIATSTFVDILITASPEPVFTVKSCAGRKVTITITDLIYDKFDINWTDGSPVETVLPGSTTTHTFGVDGFTSILVIGKFLPNATCGSKVVTPYAIQTLEKPDLKELKVLNQQTTNGQIIITYESKIGRYYRIERSTNGGGIP